MCHVYAFRWTNPNSNMYVFVVCVCVSVWMWFTMGVWSGTRHKQLFCKGVFMRLNSWWVCQRCWTLCAALHLTLVTKPIAGFYPTGSLSKRSVWREYRKPHAPEFTRHTHSSQSLIQITTRIFPTDIFWRHQRKNDHDSQIKTLTRLWMRNHIITPCNSISSDGCAIPCKCMPRIVRGGLYMYSNRHRLNARDRYTRREKDGRSARARVCMLQLTAKKITHLWVVVGIDLRSQHLRPHVSLAGCQAYAPINILDICW